MIRKAIAICLFSILTFSLSFCLLFSHFFPGACYFPQREAEGWNLERFSRFSSAVYTTEQGESITVYESIGGAPDAYLTRASQAQSMNFGFTGSFFTTSIESDGLEHINFSPSAGRSLTLVYDPQKISPETLARFMEQIAASFS